MLFPPRRGVVAALVLDLILSTSASVAPISLLDSDSHTLGSQVVAALAWWTPESLTQVEGTPASPATYCWPTACPARVSRGPT